MNLARPAARGRLSLLALAILTGPLLAGCGATAARPHSVSPVAAVRPAPPYARYAQALAVTEVQQAVGERVLEDERRYGTGTHSPCSPSSGRVFTSACGRAAAETGLVARGAVAAVAGRKGFGSLRTTARALVSAATAYQRLGCATPPATGADRLGCLSAAADIARGLPHLRDSILLGYGGD
ncbi:hypothetical protein [Streptacidiphilus rugosus]|uniref:hypothetical protein n=1 Tax=Streptacidiphilus rugosus TaxID=405783 RepID=UPI00055F1519|nr:hypothetical protein [Streptacidiphilus rugosus]